MKTQFTKTLLVFALLCSFLANAQNTLIQPNRISTPRLSYDAIVALPSPQKGDMVYDLTFLCLRVYNGSKWVCTYQTPNNQTPNIVALATAGGTDYDTGYAVAVDATGNIYVAGSFTGTANIGGIIIISAGNADIFVAKYNSIGTFQWVQTAGGTQADEALGIALDASNNVFITGYFSGTATFGGIPRTSTGNDMFILKYNSSGTFQWVQTTGGTGSGTTGSSIITDATGNVYVTGFFYGTTIFGATSKTSAGAADIFIVKYNSSGAIQWVQTAGGTSFDVGKDIVLDATGNVYIVGYFQGTTNFGAIAKTSAGGYDIFIAKYDPVGATWTWVQTAGGTGADEGLAIAIDGSSNVSITGFFNGTATFGVYSKISMGGNDIFVAQYNSSGGLLWVQTAGGTSADSGQKISIDAVGNIYVTGYYNNASFGTFNIGSVGGSNDIFIAKYNIGGFLQWIQTAGGIGNDSGQGIAIDANNNVYVTGTYNNLANFGATAITSAGVTDIFLARLQQ